MKLLEEEEEYSRRLWRSLAAQQWQCSGGLRRERESPTASPLSQWADGRQPPFIPSAPAKDSDEESESPRAAHAQPIGHPLPAASASPSPHTPISLRWSAREGEEAEVAPRGRPTGCGRAGQRRERTNSCHRMSGRPAGRRRGGKAITLLSLLSSLLVIKRWAACSVEVR